MHYRNKRVAILGFGKSGIASAEKLQSLGARITISEKKPRSNFDPELIDRFKSRGAVFEFGEHNAHSIAGSDFVVVSPGVDLYLPILEEARKQHILVISEFELAYRFLSKPIIAVTGTNGKTTTSTLIYEMLIGGGRRAALAGNIGVPLVSIDDQNLDFIVVEISSYQLEAILAFRPWIGLLLNITPDHLSRHKSIQNYARAKARIFLNQGKTDYLIYNPEDELVVEIIKPAVSRKIPFILKDLFFDPGSIKLKGKHNIENIMAATIASRLCGISIESIRTTLQEFKGVPHRIELVGEVSGVEYYNDSKATNPDSTIKALEALSSDQKKKNIILILGGLDKGVGLSELVEQVKRRVKTAILIGAAKMRFNQELVKAGYREISFAADLQNAVEISEKIAEPGDRVLLSPACASFDMFSNFEERGDVFRAAVQKIRS